MARETSEYIYGDYWLDKRRDGKSPYWQITSYEPGSRQVRYRSTGCKSLEDAKGKIHGFVERQRAKGPQKPEDAAVIPLLFNYWEEHGRNADSAGQIASSIRQFIGFLMQDEATTDVTVAQLNAQVFERFRRWRMAPHSYSVPWGGRDYAHSSPGVSGEAVDRNFSDVRAALNHNAGEARLPWVPKVPSVDKRYRSPPRDLVLNRQQMGAVIGYAAYDIEALRWVLLMIGTLVRPEAGLAFDPRRQLDEAGTVADLHPPEWPQTDKHNPVVPVIPELAPWLLAWRENPHKPVLSRKRWWRTMRTNLGLPRATVPKTIRHTVATRMFNLKVPFEEIETALGHRVLKRTSRVYAKYDPAYLARAAEALSTIFADYCAAANQWLAVHSLSTPKRGQCLTVVKNGGNLRKVAVGADGLEPPTLSV